MPIFLVDRNGMPITMRDVHNDNPNPNPNPTPTPTPTPANPTRAVISVVDHELPFDTHNRYDVAFDSETIDTLLTSSPTHLDTWLTETLQLHNPHPFVVGLDIEWRPNFQRNSDNPVATLQLCINRRCIVFQIIHSPYLPRSLHTFLSDPNHTFVGVGIDADVEKLLVDYNLSVANAVDLRSLAADVLGDREMMRAGIKSLALRVLRKEVEKPKRISRSRWDNVWLNAEQVKYATVDAFLSFEIGRVLYSIRA